MMILTTMMMILTTMMPMMMINEPGSLCGDLGHLFFHVLPLLLLLEQLKEYFFLIMMIMMMRFVTMMMVRDPTSPLPHLLQGSNKEKERSGCKH